MTVLARARERAPGPAADGEGYEMKGLRAMRVLFTSVPAPSHVMPMLPLARALRVDHDVAFATGPALVPIVEDAGFDCFAVGVDWSEPDAQRTFPELETMPLEDKAGWWYDEIFLDRAGRPMARDLTALLHRWPAEIVIHSQLEFGGWAAALAHGLPHVVFCIGGAHTEQNLPDMQDRLQGVLTAAGGGPGFDPHSTFGDLFVHLIPQSYDRWTPPVPWTRCRPPVSFPQGPLPPRPAVLDSAGDRPVVLVTFGTVFNGTPGAFELVIDALAGLDVHVVVTVGTNRDPAGLGPAPANVTIERFVAHDTLLAHCDAVVCHGGYSTVMGSLAHGVPMVIIPLSADQPAHAHQCQRLGVAETIPFAGAQAHTVRDALDRVLEDPLFAANARRVQRDILALPPPAEIIAHIEQLVRPMSDRGCPQPFDPPNPTEEQDMIREAIDANNRAFMDAVRRRDAAAVAARYTDDAVLLPPGASRLDGQVAIRNYFQVGFDNGITDISLEPTRIEILGDVMHEVGRAVVTIEPPGTTDRIVDRGKYVVVHRRVDDDWKMAVDIWNSDTTA